MTLTERTYPRKCRERPCGCCELETEPLHYQFKYCPEHKAYWARHEQEVNEFERGDPKSREFAAYERGEVPSWRLP